jgi:hypothetical protein
MCLSPWGQWTCRPTATPRDGVPPNRGLNTGFCEHFAGLCFWRLSLADGHAPALVGLLTSELRFARPSRHMGRKRRQATMAWRLGNPLSSVTAAGPFQTCTGFPVRRPLPQEQPTTNAQSNAMILAKRRRIVKRSAKVFLLRRQALRVVDRCRVRETHRRAQYRTIYGAFHAPYAITENRKPALTPSLPAASSTARHSAV